MDAPRMASCTLCCDLRLSLLRNEAATSEIIPTLSIRSSKLIGNQLGLHVIYMASLYPSEMIRIKLPFARQQIEHESISPAIPRSSNRSCHSLRSVPGRMRSSGQIGRSRTMSFYAKRKKEEKKVGAWGKQLKYTRQNSHTAFLIHPGSVISRIYSQLVTTVNL